MPRSFLMKFKDDKWKNSRATISTRDSVNVVVTECSYISEENPAHLECGARSKLNELKSESIPEVHRKGFDCNNNNNGDSNNGRQDLGQSSVKYKSHWGVKEVFASANKNNLNNDVSRLGLCKNNYISTDDNFNNNNNNNNNNDNNSGSNGNKIVFCSGICGTNATTINSLSKKRHNVLKSLSSSSSSSHSSIKWSSPSSLSSSSSSSVRPSQPKTSKGLSDIRRKIWSPPKDLEPRSAGNVGQNRKMGDAQYGGLPKFDASITPIHMFSNPFFPPQYLHPFHQSSFFFRPMIFDERVLYRASSMNLTNLYQPALSHLYPLTSYQQGNYGNLQIMTPPPQALTPPTSIHKMTPDSIADHGKRAATATPSTKHHSTVTVDSFQKSFPSPVSPVEMEKPSQTFKVTSNALNNLTVNQNSSNQSRSTNKIGYHASKFSGNFYENTEIGNSNNCKASTESGNKSNASSKSSANGVRRSATKRSSSFQEGVTIGYTYDAFFVSDGRSKRRNQSLLLSTVNNQQSDLTSSMDSSASGDHSNISTSRSATNPESTSSKSGYQQQFFTIAQHLLGQSSDNRTRYKCSECGKHYATSSNLSRHKQTHRSLDSQQAKRCPHCGKVYVSMPALSMHVLTHDLKYQCRVCQKSFSRPWLLQGHLRSHTGEKPFGCAHCGKAFADRSNLRAHMQTHSSFKLHTCKRCCKSFALKAYLNKHQESACYKDDEAAAKLDASCSNSSCSVMGSGANSGVNDSGVSGSVGAGEVGSCGDSEAGGNFDKEFYQRMSTFSNKNNNSNDDDDDDDDATYKIYNSNNYLNDNAVDVDISNNNNNKNGNNSNKNSNNNSNNNNNNIKNSAASVNYLTVY